MIRVKTINAKQFGVKFIFYLCITLLLIFIYKFFIKISKIESRAFASNTATKDNDLKLDILENELGIKINKSLVEVNEQIENEYVITDSVEKMQNQYVAKDTIKTWNRPQSYSTTITSSGKVQVGSTYISNYSGLSLNLEELSKVSTFPITKDTNILIIHTHTSESYSESGKESNFRTLDESQNVVSVGNVLKENLLVKNFSVKHCTTKHDTPSYNDAYNSCLKSLQAEFENCKYDIVLDIHRDALSGNLNYRPTAEINGESAAKLMFVVGTNGSGLQHENWMENLKLALLIQNTANEMYPGLFRDLNLSKYRYNENICDGALILEVGATGNTLDEVWNAMKYFSNVIASLQE